MDDETAKLSFERPMPRHGTRARYRRFECRCVACTCGSHGMPIPPDLRWPYIWLERKFGADRLTAWFAADTIAQWRAEGLSDVVADTICTRFGSHPQFVFPGYENAGLDAGVYP